ncbi:MAG: putative transposase [Opitutaceae bacterium]
MEDAAAALGCATTRLDERLLASVGVVKEAPLEFVAAGDVPGGGVLCALSALLLEGLLRHSRVHFALPAGFYPLETIFLVLAFMALARLRSVEALRYEPPGEWGKLIGLDRIPEVRTLRAKLALLCAEPAPAAAWSAALAHDWMRAAAPDSAGVFCVDGHVRVYHGALTQLPRRYVTRERLCLHGTTDYWTNALDGRPFFVVSRAVDPGLLTVLREDIVPRLLADATASISPAPAATRALAAPATGPCATGAVPPRLTLIFDREGYSPAFFADMKDLNIAILCHHKFPGADWPREEFAPHTLTLVHGEEVTMELAERGTCLSNGLWVREVRRRGADGTQVSILSTDYHTPALGPVAVRVCARWCQENFFKYMREHFALDRLVEHGVAPLPETTTVVNPAWRRLDQAVRRETALVHRRQAEFAARTLSPAPEPPEVEQWQRQQGELTSALAARQAALQELKAQRKATPRHVELQALPAHEQFARLRPTRKHFVDTIKLAAYRAETAMAHVVREVLARTDDARAFLRGVYRTTAELLPDAENKTLTVRLHPLATHAHNTALRHLCAELTATETVFPGTKLQLVYEIAGSA